MYIENQSLWEDLKIVIATLRICFVPDATEGVEDSGGPVETVRNRIGHDARMDAVDEQTINPPKPKSLKQVSGK